MEENYLDEIRRINNNFSKILIQINVEKIKYKTKYSSDEDEIIVYFAINNQDNVLRGLKRVSKILNRPVASVSNRWQYLKKQYSIKKLLIV